MGMSADTLKVGKIVREGILKTKKTIVAHYIK